MAEEGGFHLTLTLNIMCSGNGSESPPFEMERGVHALVPRRAGKRCYGDQRPVSGADYTGSGRGHYSS